LNNHYIKLIAFFYNLLIVQITTSNQSIKMNYQPSLYVFNSENASSKSIYQVIKDLGFGRVKYVERDNGGVYVSMENWNMPNTISTRIKLQQGKPLLLYHSDDKFWKVYAYEHRFAEEQHKKLVEKKRAIQLKRQAAALQKEREEKEAAMRRERKERERKERERKERERKEKQDQLRREQEIDEMLETLKHVSINEQAVIEKYDSANEDDSMDEHEHRKTFDVDKAKISHVVLDYGNAADMYPIIKARAKKMFDRLKNKC
jgi:hypothetical protein